MQEPYKIDPEFSKETITKVMADVKVKEAWRFNYTVVRGLHEVCRGLEIVSLQLAEIGRLQGG
jgi:hypothetical protein